MSYRVSQALACLALALGLASGLARGQVVAVKPTYSGFFASSNPTMTFVFEAPDASATLVFIPGGEGHHGIHQGTIAKHGYLSFYHFNVMLRSLSDPAITSGRFNVVIFDSPEPLPAANHWSGARTGTEHLSRVEDVARHFKERYGKPVWLMGHSLGTISVTEAYKRLQDGKRETLVAGLILSGGQNGISLDYATTRIPVLVLHHAKDECPGNTPDSAAAHAARLRKAGNTSAELVLIQSGAASGNPCRSGYHMYYEAGADAARAIDDFMTRHLGATWTRPRSTTS